MSDNMTPRDRALAGEVVKVTDERLERMRRVAKCHGDAYVFAALTELIAARKEIERLTMESNRLSDRDRVYEDNQRLRTWIRDLHSGMYINCAYCGHRYGPTESTPVSMADILKAHIEVCPEHPMSALKEMNDCLNARVASVEEERDEARKEIEKLKAERASAVGFTDLPPRPQRPTRILDVVHATSEEARAHYMMMADYWIAEAHWQEKRADLLNTALTTNIASVEQVERGQFQARIDELRTQYRALGVELETECVRLGVCGAAALGHFKECAPKYRSGPLENVLKLRAERENLRARVSELEKERDHLRVVVAREAHAQLQRAADGAAKLRRALNRITDIRPLGIDTYEECFRRMRAIALDAIGDDGPPGPKHPPRVPGHNPVG